MHKLCIIDNIWSGHFPPNVFGFGINIIVLNYIVGGQLSGGQLSGGQLSGGQLSGGQLSPTPKYYPGKT